MLHQASHQVHVCTLQDFCGCSWICNRWLVYLYMWDNWKTERYVRALLQKGETERIICEKNPYWKKKPKDTHTHSPILINKIQKWIKNNSMCEKFSHMFLLVYTILTLEHFSGHPVRIKLTREKFINHHITVITHDYFSMFCLFWYKSIMVGHSVRIKLILSSKRAC